MRLSEIQKRSVRQLACEVIDVIRPGEADLLRQNFDQILLGEDGSAVPITSATEGTDRLRGSGILFVPGELYVAVVAFLAGVASNLTSDYAKDLSAKLRALLGTKDKP